MRVLQNKLWSIGLGIALAAGPAFAGGDAPKHSKRADQPVKVKITLWGPTQSEVDAAKLRVERSDAVQKELGNSKYRLMSFEYVDNDVKNGPTPPPTRFRVRFYDYTNDRTVAAEADFAGREAIRVYQEFDKPFSNPEEFQDAVRLLQTDSQFSELLKNQKLRAFEPMPPFTMIGGERIVNVGLEAQDASVRNEIVGVSFRNNKVIRYDNNAPPTSRSIEGSCGIANGSGGTTSNGTAGQFQLTVLTPQQTVLWEMLVIRPSASSGNAGERSGIEVRDVRYKGKSVLKRGHAPVLNVKYINDTCGPFRDWQYQEGAFNAPDTGATDLAPGIRMLAAGQVATTAMESGNDSGNFRGVAIYTQNNETVLVTEMNAGWYRYIMEWRFAGDGTIRPRYGYGATSNSCVCDVHIHHTYWRFDFDIVQPNNNVYQIERGRRFMRPVTNETQIFRNYQTNRGLVIQNANGDEAYQLTPNITDGTAGTAGVLTDVFGTGDMWLLHFSGTAGAPGELDDPNGDSEINLVPWLNSESLVNQDVVVWYGAHFRHADGSNLIDPDRSPEILSGSHVVGPDLRPIRW
jgi:hypothetical protein